MGHYPVPLPTVDDSLHDDFSLLDGTRPYTGEVAGVMPTQDDSLTTKQYVDENAGGDPIAGSFLLMGA